MGVRISKKPDGLKSSAEHSTGRLKSSLWLFTPGTVSTILTPKKKVAQKADVRNTMYEAGQHSLHESSKIISQRFPNTLE